MNPEDRVMLPAIAFTSFARSFIPPELDEGFEDITTVHFEVSHFYKLTFSGWNMLIYVIVSRLRRGTRNLVQVLGFEFCYIDRFSRTAQSLHGLKPERPIQPGIVLKRIQTDCKVGGTHHPYHYQKCIIREKRLCITNL